MSDPFADFEDDEYVDYLDYVLTGAAAGTITRIGRALLANVRESPAQENEGRVPLPDWYDDVGEDFMRWFWVNPATGEIEAKES